MAQKNKNLPWKSDSTIENLVIDYTAEKKAELAMLYEKTLKSIDRYAIVEGTIVSITPRDVVISIGLKSDSIVSITEFRDIPDLKPGDQVEVYIEEQENAKGELILSRKKAKLVRGWERIQQALDNHEVLEGLVKRRTKGGLIVEVCSIEAFLPGSQIDVKPILDFDVFVGNTIDVAVVKINHANDNVVVSHKALLEKRLESQRKEIISNLEKGQILEGRVKNMTSFGVFVDLGGVDGLLHITDVAYKRIGHPEEVFQLDQQVKVVVIDFNEDKKRISLGMKQLMPHPWEALPDSVQVGCKIKGTVVNIADYGMFVEIFPGIEGLIHISEISYSQYVSDVLQPFKVGHAVETVVLALDREARKISLGIKQLIGDPWLHADFTEKYAIGTKQQGVVKKIVHFGGFIELMPGIEGLLHVADMSWTKKITHPAEIIKLGDTIETVVIGIDKENRRLSLGLKQLEENPWDTVEELFQLGALYKGTIIKKVAGKGAMVELPHGIEGYVPQGHLTKADGQEAAIGEEMDFQVIKFSKADNKIIVSHQATLSPAKGTNYKPKQKPKSTKPSVFSTNLTSTKRATLGDIEALATLKTRIEGEAISVKETKQEAIDEK